MYLKLANGQKILILEPGNIEEIKSGKMARSPDYSVGIYYTPDIDWFGTELLARGIVNDNGLDLQSFDKLHKESLQRPEVLNPPEHPNFSLVRGKVHEA